MITYKVNNQKGYEALKKRVDKGAEFLKEKWFDSKFKREVSHYEAMAVALLLWEIETGLIDKMMEEWRLK